MSYVFASDAARLAPARRGTGRLVPRWGIAFAVVAAVHGAGYAWFEQHGGAFEAERVEPPVQVALLTAQPISPQAPPSSADRPAPSRAHTGAAGRSDEDRAPVLHALARADAPQASAHAASATAGDARASESADASGLEAQPAVRPTPASATNAGVRFSLPPSGELRYNTFYNGVENAPGAIHWMSDGSRYEMVVSVPVPFVGTFSYESRGHIDAFGLAPERYVEKRGRRPQEVTTFDRTAGRIAFTRTSTSLALPEGAQDRFSMVMQLASLVRGAPQTYKPGVTRAFYVADDDSGELWPIETIGDESIPTAEGSLPARHFMRLPRHEGDRRRIDVWLAPSLGWLPARIVQTEPNGTQFELSWRGRLAPPGAENASALASTPDDSPDAEPAVAIPAQAREQP